MKPHPTSNTAARPSMQSGSTLLEVLIAIVIFVVGMLTLASLQGNLTRSSSDANMRTVAANIAEETIEGLRAFEVIASEPGKKAYADIADRQFTVQRGGVEFAVTVAIDDYYFLADRVSVSKTAPVGVTASSFKHAEIEVAWNPGIEFQIDEATQTDDRLGSGNITVSSIIPSIPSMNNARVAAEDDGLPGTPPVDYTPGFNPDIVAISLGGEKFRESTTPEPVVRRADELVETWFDVITYTNNNQEAAFLRREEFASISCECTLRSPAGSGDDGRQPTTWNGVEYDEGAKVAKQFGESASNQQSQYCDVCCQDHHDTASGPASYRPNATGSFTGNHNHYNRSNQGVLSVAGVGGKYVEACRLIRKDGFFRVAQDFALQSQTAFPEDYLDEADEVDDYSGYLTNAVKDHFVTGSTWPAHGLLFDGRDFNHPTDLPTTWSGARSQQLRSRAVYADVITPALQSNLDHCFDDYTSNSPTPTPDDADCFAKTVNHPLEIYPFFDVQLTLLSRWTDLSQGDPVEVTNDELETDNTHSRGLASLAESESGLATVNSKVETGNVGLISIAEITLDPAAQYSDAQLFISANGGTTEPPSPDPVASGTLTAASGTTTLVPSVDGGDGATCTRPDNNTFSCVIALGSTEPTMTVSNYYVKNRNLIACSPQLIIDSFSQGNNKSSTWTRFQLPLQDTTGIVVTITLGNSCP